MAIQDAAKVGLQSEPSCFQFQMHVHARVLSHLMSKTLSWFHCIDGVAALKKLWLQSVVPVGNPVCFHNVERCIQWFRVIAI